MQAGIYCTGVNYYYICSRAQTHTHTHTLPVCVWFQFVQRRRLWCSHSALCISTVSSKEWNLIFAKWQKQQQPTIRKLEASGWKLQVFRSVQFKTQILQWIEFEVQRRTRRARAKETIRKSYIFLLPRVWKKSGVHLMHNWTWLTIKLDGNFFSDKLWHKFSSALLY